MHTLVEAVALACLQATVLILQQLKRQNTNDSILNNHHATQPISSIEQVLTPYDAPPSGLQAGHHDGWSTILNAAEDYLN